MFSVEDRDRLRDTVLEWARSDSRVVAGAIVGSMAHRPGDRWSDLDLSFGVDDDVAIGEVLDDWSRRLGDGFDAIRLFDLPFGSAIYRVFLLPGCLQFDLSFAPASQFSAFGPSFRLLFGRAAERPAPPPPAADDTFGHGVHHAVRARVCIERGRYWQAEYWISAVRDHALTLACVRLGLPAYYGRGFDDLPSEVRASIADALVRALDRDDLLRAWRQATTALLREAPGGSETARRLEPWLRELTETDV
jgi:hypothetical protein